MKFPSTFLTLLIRFEKLHHKEEERRFFIVIIVVSITSSIWSRDDHKNLHSNIDPVEQDGVGPQGHSSDLPSTLDGHVWSYTKSSIKQQPQSMQSLGLLGLVFDIGLSVTPLMSHPGY